MKKKQRICPMRVLLGVLAAVYILLTLCMDVSPIEGNELLGLADVLPGGLRAMASAKGIGYGIGLLAISLYACMQPRRGLRRILFTLLPAAFIGCCLFLGKALVNPLWGNLVVHINGENLSKWAFCLPGWFLLSFFGADACFALLERAGKAEKTEPQGRFLRAANAHPFLVCFAFLLVCYLPVLILSMPGVVLPVDNMYQIFQMNGKAPFDIPRMYAESPFTNHHPFLHTVLLGGFVGLGRDLLGSAQIGLSLFTVMQVLLTALCMALALSALWRVGMPKKLLLPTLLFVGLHPRIQSYVVVVSKDMLYADAMLLVCTGLIWCNSKFRGGRLLLLLSAVLTMFLRNEGIYIMLGMLAMWFVVQKRQRLFALLTAGCCVTVWLLWTNVCFPLFRISPGSRGEMLSIPAQQTGRYIVNYEDEVTDEEREAIDGVFAYDRIADGYQPQLSDGVKFLYRENATDAQKKAYFSTWASMFKKHPMTYLEAFLANKNLWLCPSPSTPGGDTCYTYQRNAIELRSVTDFCSVFGIELAMPAALETARNAYQSLREGLFALPVLRLFTQSAPLVWAALLLICYVFYRKKWDTVPMCAMMGLMLLVIAAGPTNGEHFRYIYPLLLMLPIAMLAAVCPRAEG